MPSITLRQRVNEMNRRDWNNPTYIMWFVIIILLTYLWLSMVSNAHAGTFNDPEARDRDVTAICTRVIGSTAKDFDEAKRQGYTMDESLGRVNEYVADTSMRPNSIAMIVVSVYKGTKPNFDLLFKDCGSVVRKGLGGKRI